MSNHYMKRSLVLAMLCLSAVAHPSPVIADCDRPRFALTALRQSDFVFRGTVREIKTLGERGYQNITPRGTEYHHGWTAWIVGFDVSRVWKGIVGKRFVLHIVPTQEDDAFEWFEQGTEYLVFAQRNSPQKTARLGLPEPTYGATGCGGTTSLLTGVMYLIDLGPGRSPE